VLLQGPLDDAVVVARRIVDALSSDGIAGEKSVSVGASVGVAGFGSVQFESAQFGSVQFDSADEPLSAHTLLRRADAAMYEAKRSGKGAVVVYRDRREA
jgi:GGDEF domain-containing protein